MRALSFVFGLALLLLITTGGFGADVTSVSLDVTGGTRPGVGPWTFTHKATASLAGTEVCVGFRHYVTDPNNNDTNGYIDLPKGSPKAGMPAVDVIGTSDPVNVAGKYTSSIRMKYHPGIVPPGTAPLEKVGVKGGEAK